MRLQGGLHGNAQAFACVDSLVFTSGVNDAYIL